jgi:hypothetical protein
MSRAAWSSTRDGKARALPWTRQGPGGPWTLHHFSAFGGEGPPGSLRRLDGPSPPKAEQVMGSGAAGPSGVQGQSPWPCLPLRHATPARGVA